ncbi:hypothetical protein ACKKBG_A13760 [Auxenochlorella protothecoides x Auxenochlorella symbiontica]
MPDGPARPQWHHGVAGGSAGVATVLLLQPLDVIKTRLQVQDGIKGTLPLYQGTLDAARSIVRQEGYQALYAGLAPAVLGAGVAWGVYFFTYNRAKERYRAWQGSSGKLPAHLHLASAAEAGTLVCFVTNPLWVAKTRLQLQQRQVLAASSAATAAVAAAPYRGLVDCLVKIGRQEGIRGLYKGLVPSLFLVSHGAIQFAVYEELKALAAGRRRSTAPAQRAQREPGRAPLSSLEITVCGALSKLSASVATYPSQVIRSRLQQRVDPSRSVRYVGVAHALRLTLRREGLAGLYRGLAPNVLRVMPQSAITFVVYESIMKWLQPPPRQGSSRPR